MPVFFALGALSSSRTYRADCLVDLFGLRLELGWGRSRASSRVGAARKSADIENALVCTPCVLQ